MKEDRIVQLEAVYRIVQVGAVDRIGTWCWVYPMVGYALNHDGDSAALFYLAIWCQLAGFVGCIWFS